MDQVTVPAGILRQVLDAIAELYGYRKDIDDAITALRAALEHPAVEPVESLFREAIAWGMVYGRKVPPNQWDEMRDTMAQDFGKRAAPQAQQPAPVQEPVANIFERMHADGHVWITTIAAAKLCIANAAPQAQQPAPVQEPSMGEPHRSSECHQTGGFKCPENGHLSSVKPDDMTDEAWRQFSEVIPFRLRQIGEGCYMSTVVTIESLLRIAEETGIYDDVIQAVRWHFDKAQQPRKAVKLTDEEIAQIAAVSGKMLRDYAMGKSNEKPTVFARALETAVLKKNGVTE